MVKLIENIKTIKNVFSFFFYLELNPLFYQ